MEIYLVSSRAKVGFIDIALKYIYTLILQDPGMARKAVETAAEICVFTNNNISIEKI